MEIGPDTPADGKCLNPGTCAELTRTDDHYVPFVLYG